MIITTSSKSISNQNVRTLLVLILFACLYPKSCVAALNTLKNTYLFDCAGQDYAGNPVSFSFAADLDTKSIVYFTGFPDDRNDSGDPRNQYVQLTHTGPIVFWQYYTNSAVPSDYVQWSFDTRSLVVSEQTNYGFPTESFNCVLDKTRQVVP
jgi:hypothetical protein